MQGQPDIGNHVVNIYGWDDLSIRNTNMGRAELEAMGRKKRKQLEGRVPPKTTMHLS